MTISAAITNANDSALTRYTQPTPVVAIALAELTFHGLSTVWPIYVLAGLGAAVGAFDLPARQALLPMLVPREHLPNAISLNTIMFQTSAVLGPSIAGVLIATTGVGSWCSRRPVRRSSQSRSRS